MSAPEMTRYYTPDPAVGLFGGRWVPTGRGTVRWVQERQPDPMPAEVPIEVSKCKFCGNDFTRSKARHRYCSDDCKREGRRKQHRESQHARRRRYHPCADCGLAVHDSRAKRCKSCAVANRDNGGRWAA